MVKEFPFQLSLMPNMLMKMNPKQFFFSLTYFGPIVEYEYNYRNRSGLSVKEYKAVILGKCYM